MRSKLLVLLICALAVPTTDIAPLRQIPDDTKRGNIVHLHAITIEIDGRLTRQSDTGQIRLLDKLITDKVIIVLTSPPHGALVNCTFDDANQICRDPVLQTQAAAAPDRMQV